MNSSQSIMVIDPAAEDTVTALQLVPRMTTLEGARIGLIDNSKHMASELLDAVEELLKSRYQVAMFKRYRKRNPSVPTPRDRLSHLIDSCDAIVHGVAD